MAGKIDKLDRQIIALLQQDGRMSNVDIARAVGVTEATIRKRLERLLAQDTIRIVAVPDPAQIGLPIETIISLQVELRNLDPVLQSLAKAPRIRSIKIATGEYDIIFDALFATDEELYRFLTEQVANIPGVRKIVTSHVLREVKNGADWLIPQDQPARVLVVDDDPDFCEITRTLLEGHGYTVQSASSGEEAMKKMRQNPPDLVILDVVMKGVLDGVAVSDEMRCDKALQRVPVLMVSSITGTDYASLFPTDEYISVDNFLSKPVDPTQLLEEVRRLLS